MMDNNSNYCYNTSLAKNLREILTDTQEIARVLGCTQQAINQYKAGTSKPKLDNLIEIAVYYGVSIDWLLGRPGSVKRIEPNLQSACEYTGLSEEVVEFLHNATADDFLGKIVGKIWTPTT